MSGYGDGSISPHVQQQAAMPHDVRVGHILLSLMRGLSDKALRWASMGLAGGITIGAMVRPDPVRAGIAVFLVGLLSPLWLRRERPDGS